MSVNQTEEAAPAFTVAASTVEMWMDSSSHVPTWQDHAANILRLNQLGTPVTQATATPAGTTSTAAAKMLGLGATITPVKSTRVLAVITAIVMNSTIGDGTNAQIAYGTGAAPSNGAAATGTTVGSVKHFIASTVAGQEGLALAWVLTGLTAGTAIWVDLQFEAVTGGTATFKDVDVVLIEL